MESIFLAKVIGGYLVIFSLFMLIRQEAMRSCIKDILAQRTLLFFISLITLVVGLLLVASHNHWTMGWPIIITLFAWITLIGGVIRLFFPDEVIKIGSLWLKNPSQLKIAAVVFLIIGLFLLYEGLTGSSQ